MFGFYAILSLIISIISWVVYIYAFAFFIYFIIMNWMEKYLDSGFGKFLATICDPLVKLFDLKANLGGKQIQFSPFVWALIINVAWQVIAWVLAFVFVLIFGIY
ncbi:YggT family protein [Culicoidibacter larvae]|uniref:YggT family protein n=1 Tax=Culicoidibacter larvae TaxID=2579976 RepID=A0A5R8Q9E3_9FIRM|nr:YggT family protein [Culicoidibacter larvae]TLG71228.1 hypothetical protein FEZ08_11275 [Culicoidibacter larvae]